MPMAPNLLETAAMQKTLQCPQNEKENLLRAFQNFLKRMDENLLQMYFSI